MEKGDNRLANLALFPSAGVHTEFHKYMERVAVYVLGMTPTVPPPFQFKETAVWAGEYTCAVDLLTFKAFGTIAA